MFRLVDHKTVLSKCHLLHFSRTVWGRTRARLNRNTAQLCTSISSNAVCEWVSEWCNMYDRLTRHNSSIVLMLIEKFQFHHSISNNYDVSLRSRVLRTKKVVCFHVVSIKIRGINQWYVNIYSVTEQHIISNISVLLIKNLYERISRWEWLVKHLTKTYVSMYNIRIIINYVFYCFSKTFPYLPVLIL